jgi:hypothetical protein
MYSEQHGSEPSGTVAKSIGKCDSRGRASVRASKVRCLRDIPNFRSFVGLLIVPISCLRAVAASSSSARYQCDACPCRASSRARFSSSQTTSSAPPDAPSCRIAKASPRPHRRRPEWKFCTVFVFLRAQLRAPLSH